MTRQVEITEPEIYHLPYFVTEFRLFPYFIATDKDIELALALYRWNIELCSEFFKIIHYCEVGLRNGIAEAISNVYGKSWPWEQGFIETLHAPRRGYSQKRELMRCIERIDEDTNQVANTLSLAFWERMLDNRFQLKIWENQLSQVFPNFSMEANSDKSRKHLLKQVCSTRVFRNQIAHHQPIFTRTDLTSDLDKMLEIVWSRCQVTANWLRRTENVTSLIAECPISYAKIVDNESVPTLID